MTNTDMKERLYWLLQFSVTSSVFKSAAVKQSQLFLETNYKALNILGETLSSGMGNTVNPQYSVQEIRNHSRPEDTRGPL